MKRLLLLLPAALLTLVAPTSTKLQAQGADHKTILCHVPPGNPANAHDIVIDWNGVAFHLANHPGDHVGGCSDGAPTPQ